MPTRPTPWSFLSRRRLLAALLLAATPLGCGSSVGAGGTGGTGGSSNAGTGGSNGASEGNATTGDTGGRGSDSVTNSNLATLPTGKREAGPAVGPQGAGMARLPMQGCLNLAYFTDVAIGSQTLSLLVDSGSTTTAAAAASCTTCQVPVAYDTSHGTNLQREAKALYVDGANWEGTLFRDNMAFGSAQAAATPAVPVAFAAITDHDDFFEQPRPCRPNVQGSFDGILGIGPDAILAPGATSLLTELNKTGQLANDAFALQTCDVGGLLTVGGYASDSVAEQPQFVPMYSGPSRLAYFYSFSPKQLLVGGADIGLSQARLGPMVVDNGTNVVALASNVYDAFLAKITQDKGFLSVFPRNLFTGGTCAFAGSLTRAQVDSALPRMNFLFSQSGGTTASLSISATRSYLHPVQLDADTVVYCSTVIESEENILGSAMMREHVFIFDRANKRIGFAAQTGCDQTPFYGGE